MFRSLVRCGRGNLRITLVLALAALLSLFLGCSAGDDSLVESGEAELRRFDATLTVTLPPETDPTAFVLSANGFVELGDGAEVSGATANMGHSRTTLGRGTTTGDIQSRANVRLGERSRVNGFVRSGGDVFVPASATVTGAVERNASFEPPVTISRDIVFPASRNVDVSVRPGQRERRQPGRYRHVRVARGGELQLSSGSYYAETLHLDGRLVLDEANGPVEIFVKVPFKFEGEIRSSEPDSGLLIAVVGGGSLTLAAPFDGTVLAPRADLVLDGAENQSGRHVHGRPPRNVEHRGAFFGRSIRVERGVKVRHRPSPGLNPCLVCPQPSNQCLASVCSPFTGHCLVAPAEGRPCRSRHHAPDGEICLSGTCRLPQSTGDADEVVYEQKLAGLDRAGVEASINHEKDVKVREDRLQFDPLSMLQAETIVIPVVFHIMENPAVPRIDDAIVFQVLDTLNRKFGTFDRSTIRPIFQPIASATRIQFVLAQRNPSCSATTGIDRVATNRTSFEHLAFEYANPAQGGVAAWPPEDYLNVWVCEFTSFGAAGVAPGSNQTNDGVAVIPRVFVNDNFVLTHEVGHWLSLRHVDQTNLDPNCTSDAAANCGTLGDAVCDTPASTGCANRCPATDPTFNACPTGQVDNLENYMNSSGDATCRSMFTAGQNTRMEAAIGFLPRGPIQGADGALPPQSNADLWSRDGAGDVAVEPSPLEVVWASDDIWVRRQNDGTQFLQHENPIHRTSAPNHVYVRVRNAGCVQAPASTVTLYWSKASTGLSWPDSWNGTKTAPTGAPLGAQIGTVNVGPLGPGASTIAHFTWSPPDPNDYGDGDAAHFCLMSIIGTAPGPAADIAAMVRDSNDIVWKNVSVASDTLNSDASFGIEGTPAGVPQRLGFDEVLLPGSPGSVFEWGTIVVDLGPTLFARWVAGGSRGQNIAFDSGTSIRLLGTGAIISSMALSPSEIFFVRVSFSPAVPESSPLREFPDVYALEVNQRAEFGSEPDIVARLVGGQRLYMMTRSPMPNP